MLGLTWDCVEISAASIANGTAFIFVNKELQRVNRDALEKLNEKGIILKFPAFFARTNTALVLKEPKTKTSTRKVFLPKTVAEMLKERYQEIQEYKELFGDEFQDFNLVFCNANGRPMESQIITRALQKLIKDNDLPPVVFHSLRHSSITYKLKLNGGDIKSVQGDSGHAQVKMVTFAWLPVESMIHARQPEYYAAINASNATGESTVFIEFMLSAIKASLIDAINASDEMSDAPTDKSTMRWKQIEKFLETHEFIMNADVRALCSVSAATANRILTGFASKGKLVKYREGGHWAYRPM